MPRLRLAEARDWSPGFMACVRCGTRERPPASDGYCAKCLSSMIMAGYRPKSDPLLGELTPVGDPQQHSQALYELRRGRMPYPRRASRPQPPPTKRASPVAPETITPVVPKIRTTPRQVVVDKTMPGIDVRETPAMPKREPKAPPPSPSPLVPRVGVIFTPQYPGVRMNERRFVLKFGFIMGIKRNGSPLRYTAQRIGMTEPRWSLVEDGHSIGAFVRLEVNYIAVCRAVESAALGLIAGTRGYGQVLDPPEIGDL